MSVLAFGSSLTASESDPAGLENAVRTSAGMALLTLIVSPWRRPREASIWCWPSGTMHGSARDFGCSEAWIG
jgi:hypothetical protein